MRKIRHADQAVCPATLTRTQFTPVCNAHIEGNTCHAIECAMVRKDAFTASHSREKSSPSTRMLHLPSAMLMFRSFGEKASRFICTQRTALPTACMLWLSDYIVIPVLFQGNIEHPGAQRKPTEPILRIGTQARGHFTQRGSAAHVLLRTPSLCCPRV